MSRQRSMEVIEQAEYVTIGELVRLTAVRYSTLKFYTEEGMLPFEQAEENLTRRQFRRLKRFWMWYRKNEKGSRKIAMNRHPFSYNLFLEFKNMYKAILENYASSMLSATSGRILLTAPW